MHALAHLKEAGHNKAFYRLCTHVEPDCRQLGFDLRPCLAQRDVVQRRGGGRWVAAADEAAAT